MGIVTKILTRVIGVQFYQRHAGLFLFIFILMFGVVHGEELWYYHLSLMYALLGSTIFMAVVASLWFLYAMKCAQFTLKILSDPQQQFLYVVSGLPKRKLFASLFF